MADAIEGREETLEILVGTLFRTLIRALFRTLKNWPKADAALAEFGAGKDLGLKFISLAEEQAFADADFAAGPDQALPIVRFSRKLAGQQNLDAAVEEIARGRVAWADGMRSGSFAAAIESSRKDAGIVEDQQVAGMQEIGKFAEQAVSMTTGSVQVEHARSVASGEGLLGNEVFGKMKVEVGNQHGIRL